LFGLEMGITRSSFHKRRQSTGKRKPYRKKRQHEMGRQPANTKIGVRRVHPVRVRGGNYKLRALRLDCGNYAWPSFAIARKTRILQVVYHPFNNELVRTNTLVRGAIVEVDATPFKQWYEQQFGIEIKGKVVTNKDKDRKKKKASETALEKEKEKQRQREKERLSKKKIRKKVAAPIHPLGKRPTPPPLDPNLLDAMTNGKFLAYIGSRPGQIGRADGYILEAKELEFYLKKLQKKGKSK